MRYTGSEKHRVMSTSRSHTSWPLTKGCYSTVSVGAQRLARAGVDMSGTGNTTRALRTHHERAKCFDQDPTALRARTPCEVYRYPQHGLSSDAFENELEYGSDDVMEQRRRGHECEQHDGEVVRLRVFDSICYQPRHLRPAVRKHQQRTLARYASIEPARPERDNK